ncbi:MAG: hypothetical protein AAF682_26435 [Planctomycetota bacterium]
MNVLSFAALVLGVPWMWALLAPPDLGEGEERTPGAISLTLVDSDIRDALRMVAAQADVDIVMSPSVQGEVTLDLRAATLEETLAALVTVGGFHYSIENDVVTVASLEERIAERNLRREYATEPDPAEPEVLVVRLRYVDAERVLPVVEALLSEVGTVTLLKTPDHVAADYGPAGGAQQANAQLQIGGQLATTSQGRPAKSHTLVVVDLPERLARVRQVVQDVDVMPLSIVIEARFVEIGLDEEDRLGIDWNVLASASGAAAPHTAPFGGTSLGSFGPSVDGGSAGGVFPPAPNLVTTPGAAGLYTFGTLDFSSFTALLELIRSDSRVQVVSNPRVVVKDRHTATILVGERFPILSANISEFGTVTEQLDRYEPVGVQLVVTPSVLKDDEVELFVRPSSSSLGPIVEGSTGLQIARINSRQIDTAVSLRDGQTVVLGGLITARDDEVVRTVPFLGSIPYLGKLFTHRSSTQRRNDLVVFLTVSIVREPGLTEAQRELFERTTFELGDARMPRPLRELRYGPSEVQY